MGYFKSKLAREVAQSTGWRDKVFSRRYQAILVSDEEEAQVGRLIYILSHGCKENLIVRPQDWPGVHCVTALLTGEPIEGTWFDRTKEWAACLRGEEVGVRQFAETEVVNLSPLPCWRHLLEEQYRERNAEVIEAIIAQAAARGAATEIEPLGAVEILRYQPFSQPTKTKKSAAPLVHAARKRVRIEMEITYRWFVRAFREAAEFLRAGDRLVRFPRGSFPPGLPFVRAGWLAISPETLAGAASQSKGSPPEVPTGCSAADDRCPDASARRSENPAPFDPEVIPAEESAATRSAGRRFRPRVVD